MRAYLQLMRLPNVFTAMADIALEVEDEREIAEALEEISSGSAFWSKK